MRFMDHVLNITIIYSLLAVIFFAVLPSLNPFLNLRVKVFMYLIRPVPTVLRPLAFSPQLKFLIFLAGYPQLEHVFFWMWYEILPQRRQAVWDLLCLFPNEVVPLVCSCDQTRDIQEWDIFIMKWYAKVLHRKFTNKQIISNKQIINSISAWFDG